MQDCCKYNKQKGIALVTALFFLVIVTALVTAAIMLATVQVKVAGSVARWEEAFAAAEGGVNYVAPLIQSIHYGQGIPPEYAATVQDINLLVEMASPDIKGDLDTVLGPPAGWTPDVVLTMPQVVLFPGQGLYTVRIDIDTYGTGYSKGENIEGPWKYHGGGGGSGGQMVGYRVTSRAMTANGNTSATVTKLLWNKVL